MSDNEQSSKVVEGILIVVSGMLFTFGGLVTQSIWNKTASRFGGFSKKNKQPNSTGFSKFAKGQRTRKDGQPNATFNKTEAQHKAQQEGRIGRPVGSKNK